MKSWLADNSLAILGAATLGLFGLGIYLGIQEQKQWDAFAVAHECKLIAHKSGYSMYGFHNGKYQTYYVPSQDTYHCNDGVDYTR
jgi:hypothetical protein